MKEEDIFSLFIHDEIDAIRNWIASHNRDDTSTVILEWIKENSKEYRSKWYENHKDLLDY